MTARGLNSTLELMLGSVPEELVPRAAHGDLLGLGRVLPPVHHCGFEVRLGSSLEVDFQQRIGAQEDDRQLLRRYLRRPDVVSPVWRSIETFLDGWEDPSLALNAAITDIWLEFDRPPVASLSVFLGLSAVPVRTSERLEVVSTALDLLIGSAWRARFEALLAQSFYRCPQATPISHIGLMLGRPTPFLRLQFVMPEDDKLATFLGEVCWPGPLAEALELAAGLRTVSDEVRLCVDLEEQVIPRLGFECIYHRQPPEEPGWERLLDDMVARGWCTEPKRRALLAWPQRLSPVDGAVPWPPELVYAALGKPADHFTFLDRKLSHIKVVYQPGEQPEAKGYFGYLHEWARPVADSAELGPSAGKPLPARRPAPASAATASDAAVDFLLAARTRSGWWRDFAGTMGAQEAWGKASGPSDEWVTAFVAVALIGSAHPGAGPAWRQAWSLLADRRLPTGGWGYNRLLPVDGDSTSWGLQLAQRAGDTTAAAAAGRAILAQHRCADGGTASYIEASRPRPPVASVVPPNGSYAGWCGTSHACVTAATALLGDEDALEYLLRAQRNDGSWAAYWWENDEYATALAAEALTRRGTPDDLAATGRAVAWALRRVGIDGSVAGSAFATAWVVRTLKLAALPAEVRDHLEAATGWLVKEQLPDGSWESSARLVSPRPDFIDRAQSPVPILACLDDARLFTTATVLPALLGPVT